MEQNEIQKYTFIAIAKKLKDFQKISDFWSYGGCWWRQIMNIWIKSKENSWNTVWECLKKEVEVHKMDSRKRIIDQASEAKGEVLD